MRRVPGLHGLNAAQIKATAEMLLRPDGIALVRTAQWKTYTAQKMDELCDACTTEGPARFLAS
jgi:hypothetical protein